jgi:hypothetical protein
MDIVKILLFCILMKFSSAAMTARYELYGLASGTQTISSTIDTANQPIINLPGMF